MQIICSIAHISNTNSKSKNNVKYEEKPAFIAYHELNEEEFKLVESFEEE